MFRLLTLIFVLSISFNGWSSNDELPKSLKLTMPHSSRTVLILFSMKEKSLIIDYEVFEKNQTKKQKSFDEVIQLELQKQWKEILPAVQKAKNNYVCVNSISWTVTSEKESQKTICDGSKITQKLARFQQSIQMLMTE